MDERVIRIREFEEKSHTNVYTNETLYASDIWLRKPVKTVQNIVPLFHEYEELHVLDLGCGVGRNAIFIAEECRHTNCVIDCVDILPVAIEKLNLYAKEYNVLSSINGICQSIEEFSLQHDFYDLVLAVSSLEHVDSHASFMKKLAQIKNGTRENGIICLILNSNITEMNLETMEPVPAQFECNYTTENLLVIINQTFYDWTVLRSTITEQEYDIPRETFLSHLKTNVVTFVARKGK